MLNKSVRTDERTKRHIEVGDPPKNSVVSLENEQVAFLVLKSGAKNTLV